jgi:hypothetical protein
MRSVDQDRLELETKKSQLEAAQWPKFGDIARGIAAALSALMALIFAPTLAQDQGPKKGMDLYDRPVLAIELVRGVPRRSIWRHELWRGSARRLGIS